MKRISTATLGATHIVIPDIKYLIINKTEIKLDLYVPAISLGEPPWTKFTQELKPVLIYIHGGGWNSLSRTNRNLEFLPYLEKGFAVANIDYRLVQHAKLPAPIADCRYALNWIYKNSKKYRLDTNKIVVSGESAGGHLALMTGMIDDDRKINIPGKPIKQKLRVASIVNWFGISDLKLRFKNDKNYARLVAGPRSRQEEIFDICSPINYVGKHTPPIFSIHGDKDPIVPYEQSLILHKILDKKGIKNKLYTVKNKKHGNFSAKERTDIFNKLWHFLNEIKIIE